MLLELNIEEDETSLELIFDSSNRIKFGGEIVFSNRSFYDAVQVPLKSDPTFFRDCKRAFTSRNIESADESYSTGSTFFIRATTTPRCLLEKLALSIFKVHTNFANFDPANSGAEWWSLSIDSRDDVGFHWDRDYGQFIVTLVSKTIIALLTTDH
jgi:hypothetical protein